MRYLLAIAILVTGLSFSDAAWALKDKDMALGAMITMEQAIKTAVDSVPGGRAYEAEMDKEDGRATYKIELVDPQRKTYRVKVDATTGQLIKKQ
jgi:uncharacterized membrane protein YkoI